MKLFLVLLIMISVFACSSNVVYKTKGASTIKHRKFGKKIDPESESQEPLEAQTGDVLYFVCSYYGKKFHGRQTSNGEIFDMYKFTCAHKTLPFNTKMIITNEDNGKSVIVRVNDRGPFIEGRDLDISYAAAKEIGMIAAGVKRLKIEIVD